MENPKGILVVNHFLKTEKFNTLHGHLIESAKEAGIELALKTNLELATERPTGDFVLFWDKDVVLARRLENEGFRVFNSSDSIRKCDNKAETYVELLGTVPQPKTLISPLTYFKTDLHEFVTNAVDILGLPLVLKECYGSFGEGVYLCNTEKEINEIAQKISPRPFILQQFIKEAYGCDTRLEVVHGKVVAAIERENKNDFRANLTNGGVAKPHTPTSEECAIALTACEKLGLSFGGVDILNGNTLCEVNSNAHIINIMNVTGVDIAPHIFECIKTSL